MGTDNIFKNKRAPLKERKREHRIPKPNSFLIVSEGTKTEPMYFDGLAKYINEKFGKGIDSEKPLIDPQGEGKCTVSLVRATERIVSRAKILYSQVWVVFDKDDFSDFDEAIALAEELGYRTGWSNQSFEYWIFLHFNYSDSALHRDDWVEKLSKLFIDREINPKGYQKNNPNIFDVVTKDGGLKTAVGNAKRISASHREGTKPSECDPCTTVHNLILELKPYLTDLLQ